MKLLVSLYEVAFTFPLKIESNMLETATTPMGDKSGREQKSTNIIEFLSMWHPVDPDMRLLVEGEVQNFPSPVPFRSLRHLVPFSMNCLTASRLILPCFRLIILSSPSMNMINSRTKTRSRQDSAGDEHSCWITSEAGHLQRIHWIIFFYRSLMSSAV